MSLNTGIAKAFGAHAAQCWMPCVTWSWAARGVLQVLISLPIPDCHLADLVQVYAAPILFERNAYDVPVFTRVHDFMWSGMALRAWS